MGINSDYGVSKLIYGGFYHDKRYSEGKNFSSENRVINVIMRAIDGGHFPNDQDGIYLVFGSRFDIISFLVLRFTLAKFCIFEIRLYLKDLKNTVKLGQNELGC